MKQKAAALTFRDIQIEEVAVEDGLNHPGNDGDHVKESLEVEPPYPVEEVEGSVEAQEEQVVGGDGLGLTGLADHEQLGQDGHRLQVYGERPQNLGQTEEGDGALAGGKLCTMSQLYTEKYNIRVSHTAIPLKPYTTHVLMTLIKLLEREE